MTVEEMINSTLVKEGGFVNHPADKGGPTNYGITQATLSKYLQRVATVREVKDLDADTARHIYELRYYREPRIDRLPKPIQHFVFDCAVNHGPRRAIKFTQKVCAESGFGELAQDGLMGPRTKAAADQCHAQMGEWMLLALIQERKLFYLAIASNNPRQKVFLEGWINRANSFLQ